METNAEQLLRLIKDQKLSAIDNFLKTGQPEGVFLDFKEKHSHDGTEPLHRDDVKNFSKALSGFANSAGGIVVWGIGDRWNGKQKVASEDKLILNVDDFVRYLNQQLPESVTRAIDGVEIFSITRQENSGYVIVYVPESSYAPHRAEGKLKKYYRRVGDRFSQMEHYEIEDMFGRRQRPIVSAKFDFQARHSSNEEVRKYQIVIDIENEGRSMASCIGLDFEFPKVAIEGVTGPRNFIIETSRDDDRINIVKYRSKSQSPLFPQERARIFPNNYLGGHFHYYVTSDIRRNWEDTDLNVTIYADNAPPRIHKIKFDNLHNF